jgi:hypothetical protein
MIRWLEQNVGPQSFQSGSSYEDKDIMDWSMPTTTLGKGWKVDTFVIANGRLRLRNEITIDDDVMGTMFALVSKQWQ